MDQIQAQIDALKQELEDTKAELGLLKSGYTFPLDVEQAIRSRLGTLLIPAGTGSAGAATVISAFPFNLPANPSGTLSVVFNGTTYNLLYK